MAVGLGSMDTPVPSIAKWEWLNWKFPRPVHAGDTIYARWTLTQKRPPVGPVATAIVVWRVDVHTADGQLCAEGEVGASVTRHAIPAATAAAPAAQEPAQPGLPASRRRRRRRTTPASAGTKVGADGAASVVEPVAEAPAKPATPERSSSSARRRRRRRPAGSSPARNGETPTLATPVEAPPPPPVVATTAAVEAANPLRRVIRRLRRP
jgi:hypothetical protein